MLDADSLSKPMFVPEAGAATRPLLDRVHDWIITVDHKKLGLMYVGYGVLFLVIGGIEATIMRSPAGGRQQSSGLAANIQPPVHHAWHDHGVSGRPCRSSSAFANYLVPLMIGARDMAFPAPECIQLLDSALGGVLLYYSYIGGNGLYGAGTAPDVGWFAYAPLTAQAFSPGHSTDYWIIGAAGRPASAASPPRSTSSPRSCACAARA